MRKLGFLFLLLPFVPLGGTACDQSENPASPNQTALAGDEAATAGPLSAARHGTKMVPYKADASFWPGTTDVTPCYFDGTQVAALSASSVGEGRHTHLGWATSVITDDYCTAFLDGSLLAGGTFTHTGANGDSFSGLWDAFFTPPTFEFVANEKAHPLVATGGTGRFAGASGYFYGGGTIDPATGAGTFSAQGVISSVGSLK